MNLYLIDGNSYVYRAFYAIKDLANSEGFPANAIYGFTNMLIKIIREKKPDSIAVSFDTSAPTERHMIYQDYKVHRPEMPSALAMQFPYIRKMISAFRIKIFEIPGYEADDLIGTVAKKAANEGVDVFIVTADKDMLQLVDGKIKIYDPVKDKILDADYVRERFGVGPERVPEFMALVGDVADNIPGVKGIGEKTAKELLTSSESLSDLLEHPEKIRKDKIRSLVTQNREVVLLSHKLAAIDTSAPVGVDFVEFNLKEPDWISLFSLFKEFEFTSLMKLIPSKTAKRSYETITSPEKLMDFISSIHEEVALDLETTGGDPLSKSLVGLALCNETGKGFYVPLAHRGFKENIDKSEALKIIGPVLRDNRISKIGHNFKHDLLILENEGISPAGKLLDTMIAAYLLNPNKSNHNLGEVALEYLAERIPLLTEVLKKRSSFSELGVEEAAPYSAGNAALCYDLKKILFEKLTENGLEDIYFRIEIPLTEVLADMERCGVKVDAALLRNFSKELESDIESIQKRVHFMAGEEFNINSPKQLSKILFFSLGLSPSRKTKTGYSTDVDVLEELAEHHELPREVLNYRTLSKLKTTYIDVLPTLVNPITGRVHTSFNQTITATGRLSSSDPNLQNIPIRGEWGKRIRSAFIAERGNILLSADYSQVELRVLAHLSGDGALIEAFSGGQDIHSRTASELYGVAAEKVTPDMRRTAKMVNFGIIYGISPFGLSEALNIDKDLAREYIDLYFQRHPGVRNYIEKTLSEAFEKGYVTTMFGRRRPIPELKSHNKTTRQLGERLAVNSPVQGTAADVIKIAMINIRRRFRKESLRAKMILQVHDELLFELPEAEQGPAGVIVKEEMEGVVPLAVPLRIEMGYGLNWAEAH